MKIHCIQTGTVRIKENQRQGRGRGVLRQLSIFAGLTWTEPLPILAWAIETDEGIVLVDTGEIAQARQPGYFPKWHPFYSLALEVNVAPEDEIGPQLRRIGIMPDDVRTVVLTHLHSDHCGGVGYFPHATMYVTAREHCLATGALSGLAGYTPRNLPEWFKPQLVEFDETPLGPFAGSKTITADGRVVMVPTPGHTPGHASVIVIDEDRHYFLAGDASYSQQLLVDEVVDGISPHHATSLRSLRTIAEYARRFPTVYLPSHEFDSARRLREGAVLRLDAVAALAAG